MLQITIPATEQWDEARQQFVTSKEQTLQLEHSLVSLSKWESKWCKSFLARREMTYEETIDYIKCMTITQNVKDEVYYCLTKANIEQIYAYIEAPMTATYFSKDPHGRSGGEKTTSELIYYWMIQHGIPFECQKWHLNRLLTLIKVCAIKSQPAKKMSKRDILAQNQALNASRRRQLNTRG